MLISSYFLKRAGKYKRIVNEIESTLNCFNVALSAVEFYRPESDESNVKFRFEFPADISFTVKNQSYTAWAYFSGYVYKDGEAELFECVDDIKATRWEDRDWQEVKSDSNLIELLKSLGCFDVERWQWVADWIATL